MAAQAYRIRVRRATVETVECTYSRCKVFDFHSVLHRHMYPLLIPSRFVDLVYTKSDPHIPCEVGGFLSCERLLDHDITVLEEERDLLLCRSSKELSMMWY